MRITRRLLLSVYMLSQLSCSRASGYAAPPVHTAEALSANEPSHSWDAPFSLDNKPRPSTALMLLAVSTISSAYDSGLIDLDTDELWSCEFTRSKAYLLFRGILKGRSNVIEWKSIVLEGSLRGCYQDDATSVRLDDIAVRLCTTADIPQLTRATTRTQVCMLMAFIDWIKRRGGPAGICGLVEGTDYWMITGSSFRVAPKQGYAQHATAQMTIRKDRNETTVDRRDYYVP